MSRPFIMGAERAAATLEKRRTISALQTNTRDDFVQDEGHEPDYRFTLANERTFLAWIRTAFALLAGSVAMVQLVPHFALAEERKALGGLLAIISIAIAVHSGLRWHSVQQAMRRDAPLPSSMPVWLLTGGTILVSTIVFLSVAIFGIGEG